MKKKFKDLTIQEIVRLCDKNRKKYGSCDKCPFIDLFDNCGICICGNLDRSLNETIDIEEDLEELKQYEKD